MQARVCICGIWGKKFLTQPIAKSRLKIPGDSRKITILEAGEKQYIAAGVNEEELQLVKLCNEGKQ